MERFLDFVYILKVILETDADTNLKLFGNKLVQYRYIKQRVCGGKINKYRIHT